MNSLVPFSSYYRKISPIIPPPDYAHEMNYTLETIDNTAFHQYLYKTNRDYLNNQVIREGELNDYIFSKDLNIDPPLITYRVIKFIVENAWEKLLNVVHIDPNTFDSKSFTTSCTNTAHLIEKLLGLKLMNKLECVPAVLDIPLSLNNQDQFCLFIPNLLGSGADYELKTKWHSKKVAPQEDNFIDKIKPKIDQLQKDTKKNSAQKIQELTTYLNNLEFNFGCNEIKRFSAKLFKNEHLVSNKNSYMYAVAFLAPNYIDGNYVKEVPSYAHIELIEQYYSTIEKTSLNKVRYRVYQSMVLQVKLNDDFKKRNYGNYEEGTWNSLQLCEHIKTIYHFFEKNQNKSFEDCFGYPSSIDYPLHTLTENTLNGITFRFSSSAFNPTETVKKLAELINSDTSLKNFFSIKY